MKHFDFINALVTFNCDPYVVENEDQAKDCEDYLNTPGIEVEEITKSTPHAFVYACNLLDLDLSTATVQRIYVARVPNNSPMYFLLDSDWSVK